MSNTPIVYAAAAGSGKTTQLVCEYLQLLKTCEPRSIIAITFTRAAGAELIERVAKVLRAVLGDPDCKAELGSAWGKYAAAAPDADRCRRALRGLFDAPVGTTDSFVQALLGEFAVHAVLPLGDGTTAALDQPIGLGATAEAYATAAREVIEPATGGLPPAAELALRDLTLAELTEQVAKWARRDAGEELWMAAEVAERLLPVAESVVRELVASVRENLARLKDKARFAAVQAWLDAGAAAPGPHLLLAYVANQAFPKGKPTKLTDLILAKLAESPALDLGTVQLPVAQAIRGFAEWTSPEAIARADALRRAIAELADACRARARALCASSNTLDYELLLDAAIALCESPPPHLRTRFGALLVDEAQDANPRQARLYRALSQLPGGGRALPTTYVGDVRQSIYLFRGAEPEVFADLQRQAGGQLRELLTARRPTPALAAAQKALFLATSGTADGSMAPQLPGLQPVDQVQSSPDTAKYELSEAHRLGTAPIVIAVRTPNPDSDKPKDNELAAGEVRAAAVDLFAQRMQDAWAHESAGGTRHDSAVVLAATWRNAQAARDRLRVLLGGRDKAFLDGSTELAKTTTVRDLRLLVQALWDPRDRQAVAALWKTPLVGLSDGGLATLNGTDCLWVRDTRRKGLEYSLLAERLADGALDDRDRGVFDRCQPLLREAVGRIGREPTADIVESLATALHWRTLLAVSPDGQDAVAHLEVALDWVRSAEREGVDPNAVVQVLDENGNADDGPRVKVGRGQGTVSCTTIFQAKGLEWDHVCLVDAGMTPEAKGEAERVFVGGQERILQGVELDPAETLNPKGDPIKQLAKAVGEARRQEERLRTAYVGVTRARRSVTLALGDGRGIHQELRRLWAGADHELPGVKVLALEPPEPLNPLANAWVEVAAPLPAPPEAIPAWQIQSPSSAEVLFPAEQRKELALAFAQRALPQVRRGGERLDVPKAVRDMPDNARGNLVHAWMASHGLERSPNPADATAFLTAWPTVAGAETEKYLLELGQNLATAQPGIYHVLTEPGARRYAELPVLGVAGAAVLPGRVDLLVERPNGKWWIVDWKGGNQVDASSAEHLVKSAHLEKYAAQLQAYRQAVEATGRQVEAVGLLFVGAWDWVGVVD